MASNSAAREMRADGATTSQPLLVRGFARLDPIALGGAVGVVSGLGLFLGRRKLVEYGKPPNLTIPAALLILAAVTTPFL